MRISELSAAVVLLSPAVAYAQDAAQIQYDSAYYAWDAGNYPDALARLRRLLTGPANARFLEPVALLTGELYSSTEIAPPQRYVVTITGAGVPKWSAEGRYFAFETTSGPQRTTHIYRMNGMRAEPVAQVDGFGASFSEDGARVVFLRVQEDEELRAARAQSGQGGGRGGRQGGAGAAIAALEARKAQVIERELASGQETVHLTGTVTRSGVVFGIARDLYLTGGAAGATETQVYRIGGGDPVALTSGTESRRLVAPLAGGRLLVTSGNNAFAILDPASQQTRSFDATSYAASADGASIVFMSRTGTDNIISIVSVADGRAVTVKTTPTPMLNPVISPDGRKIVFQMMPREDWELYVIDADGKNERRLTREIQHDHTPRFLTNEKVLGVIGENRHRRSYVYDLNTGRRERLFHNNHIRTVAQEYFWAVSPDGSQVVIIADRDGDTITPERGVYVMDLSRKVTAADVVSRIDAMAAAEKDLRARGEAMFAPVAARIRAIVRDASPARVYGYEKAMFDFDSKFITQPGNAKAIEYIANTLRSFGYEPEIQRFEPRDGVPSANVIATLKGTRDPDLVYVVSSHFDSVERGPGADDDTSGSAALLEAARILAGKPMPATIKFAWFTGEEAGLRGSREFVRLAVADSVKIVGALNNDMIGWANDHRLDNTIRYSNPGLRDLQHAAAFLFTNLILYDSRYYQSTDAQAYFDAYGDIVGGIGSYPILGNPHYHQPHDLLETMNHQLITEVAKTTAASLVLMASSPSRLKDLVATSGMRGVNVKWTPAPESGITGYIVAYGPSGTVPDKRVRVATASATLPLAKVGDQVWVKSVNAQGMEAWDWARAVVR